MFAKRKRLSRQICTYRSRKAAPSQGYRCLITFREEAHIRRGLSIGQIDLVDDFDDWQLVCCPLSLQAIICPGPEAKITVYMPKGALNPELRSRIFDQGTWFIPHRYFLPANLSQSLGLPGGCIHPARYIPMDIGSHLVFEWRVVENPKVHA